MKAKAASRACVTSMRTDAAKPPPLIAIDPLTRPRPFLVQALRLRQRAAKAR